MSKPFSRLPNQNTIERIYNFILWACFMICSTVFDHVIPEWLKRGRWSVELKKLDRFLVSDYGHACYRRLWYMFLYIFTKNKFFEKILWKLFRIDFEINVYHLSSIFFWNVGRLTYIGLFIDIFLIFIKFYNIYFWYVLYWSMYWYFLDIY